MIFPVAICLCLSGFAQEGGEVRGVVLDALGGEPLERVQVQLAGTAHQTATGAEGRFSLAGVQPGDYTLHVSTVGYRLLKKPFSLAGGETKEFEVVLSPDTFRQIDSVEVTAGPFEPLRPESPSERRLAGVELKNLASVLADDPLRAVQGLPGVASNDDFNSRFYLRGASYHRIGLYLDDVLLHAPFHMVAGEPASGSMTSFQGDTLQDVALHPGAFPSRFSDRTAGVLDLHTREGTRLAPSIRVTASASNSGFLAEGPLGRARRGAWMAAVRKSYLQYIIRRTSDDPTLAFGFLDSQLKLSYDLDSKNHVSLSVIDGISDLDRTDAWNKLGLNSLMLSDYHLAVANLAWRYAPGPGLLVENRLAYLRERFNNRNRDRTSLAAGYYGEWIWTATASWIQSPQAALDAGWSLRRLRDDGYRNRYQFNPLAILRLEEHQGNAVRPGGFLEQSWSPAGGRVRLSAGARWDSHSVNDVGVVLPHAAVALRLHPSAQLSLGWGQYAQFPELQWLLSRIGDRRLLPERSNHLLAAFEHRPGDRTRVRIEFYDRADRDLLFRPFYEPRLIGGRIYNPPLDSPVRNSGRGYGRGFEIFVQQRTANRLTGWVSYAYGRARIRDGEARVAFPSDQDQRHTVNVYGSYRVRPTVNLSLKWIYGSGFPIPGFLRLQDGRYFLAEQRNALRLDPYQRADIRINKAYVFDRWKLTLYGEVVNLFNRDNYRFDTFDGYNSRTGRASVRFDKMFPILPSAGVVLEFEGRR